MNSVNTWYINNQWFNFANLVNFNPDTPYDNPYSVAQCGFAAPALPCIAMTQNIAAGTRWTFYNGNYIEVGPDSYNITNNGGLYFYNISVSTTNYVARMNFVSSNGSSQLARYKDGIAYLSILSDGGNNYAFACVNVFAYDQTYVEANTGHRVKSNVANAFLDNAIAPTYIWHAWDQLAGNSGKYRCNLTKIKDNSIGDFSTYVTGAETDMDRFSQQASIWNIYRNTPYGEETTIAWSGNGWLTLTLSEVQGFTPTMVKFTFKFYRREISATTPFYTQEYSLITGGDVSGRYIDLSLSFVYDATEGVAVFLPVMKNVSDAYIWGEGGTAHTTEEMGYLFMWLTTSGSPEGDSPYSTGTTDNGGNPGGPTPQSHIPTPGTPTLDATLSGMFTIYCPTDAQLAKISQFLWSDNVINNIKKYFNNFSDNIMAFYVLPCKPLNNPTKKFKVGNMESDDADLASVEYLSGRFIKLDLGDVVIKPCWDSYLDFAPYSSIQICLPGIGCQTIDIDDVMCPALEDGSLSAPESTAIHLDYTIDLMTGVLAAFVSINGEMRYQFPGKLGYSIPLTGENYTRMAQGYVTAVAGLIGTVATGGAAAPFAASATAAGIINAMKPEVYRGGNLSGDASMLCSMTPYLIYRRPNKPLLEDQVKYTGFPSYKSGKLSEFEGLTTVLDAHIEGISCTEAERAEILQLLKSGVIL